MLNIRNYSHPKWISEDEIVYIKSDSYLLKGSYPWDFPKRYVKQICRENIYQNESEKILLELAYVKTYDPKKGHQYKYKNKRFKGCNSIRSIDVSITAQKIVFEIVDGGEGIYIIDFDGGSLKCILPFFSERPLFSPDGNKILFYTGTESSLKKMNFNQGGLFVHDLESGENRLLTSLKSDGYHRWINDEKIFIRLKLNPEDRVHSSYVMDMTGNIIEEIIPNRKDPDHSQVRSMKDGLLKPTPREYRRYSFDNKYWIRGESVFFEDESNKIQEIKIPIPFPHFKSDEWNPGKSQFLLESTLRGNKQILVIEVPSMEQTTLLEESQ